MWQSGRPPVTVASPEHPTYPILFDQEGLAGAFSVYSINRDGTNLRGVVTKAQRSQFPAWTPDHARIAYAVNTNLLHGQIVSPTGDSLNSQIA